MQTMEERFAEVTAKMSSLDMAIDPNNPAALMGVKTQLDEVIGDLEGFVEERLVDDPSEKAQGLMKDVKELLEQTKMLRNHIARTAGATVRALAAANVGWNGNDSDGDSDRDNGNGNGNSPNRPASPAASASAPPQPELRRDEIAKLLLLISRAYSLELIAVEQRSFLKSEVVCRKGYLRRIVRMSDIPEIMQALAEISAPYKARK